MTPQNSDARRALRPWTGVAIAAIGTIAIAGCNETAVQSGPHTGTYSASLASFATCDELDDYLTDVVTEIATQNYVYGYGYVDAVTGGRAVADGAEGDGGMSDPAPSSPTDFTETNVQELGVDEPDLVKTNGDYLFAINGETLHVIDSWPAEDAHEASTFDLPGWGEQMFLVGDRVVAFTHVHTGESPWDGGRREPTPEPDVPGDEGAPEGWEEPVVEPDPLDDGDWFSGTRVTVIDVADPSAPTATATFDIEGQFVSARLVDGVVYMVSRSELFGYYDPDLEAALDALELPPVEWDTPIEEREAMEESVSALLRPIVADYIADGGRDAVIPDLRTTSDDRANLFDCTSMMYPETHAGVAVLSVVGFDPASADPSGVGLVADGWQVYGSLGSLYIAQDSRWWFWGAPEDPFAATHIHKFTLNGGDPVYSASGEVTGWLLNQFSMSEFDGYLRVATTDSTSFGMWGDAVVGDGGGVVVEGGDTGSATTDAEPPPSADAGSSSGSSGSKTVIELRDDPSVDANNVFVLEQVGGTLEVVGGIRGIAPTEQIFAVRFIGDTGYVVTFRQTDPLFVVDLSNPTSPVLRGELHVPGYSGYLHPLDDGHLIGIGRNGDESGRLLGLQLSVFDVSNPDAPVRSAVHNLDFGESSWSYSEAEHDHHAFTFYPSRGLLAIPVTMEDWTWEDDTYSHFSGIIAFDVTADSITEAGRVSHTMMARDRYCADIDTSDPEPVAACSSWDYPWWVHMRRSVFIEDFLFALSDMGVTTSSIDTLDEVLAEVRYY